jgi:hypothetical protein
MRFSGRAFRAVAAQPEAPDSKLRFEARNRCWSLFALAAQSHTSETRSCARSDSKRVAKAIRRHRARLMAARIEVWTLKTGNGGSVENEKRRASARRFNLISLPGCQQA